MRPLSFKISFIGMIISVRGNTEIIGLWGSLKKSYWTRHQPSSTLVFSGWQFSMLPFRAVNIYYIILTVNWIHHLLYVLYQNNPGQVNICVFISFYVYSNANTVVRRQSESMVKRTRINSAHSTFFGISPVGKQFHPLLHSITC